MHLCVCVCAYIKGIFFFYYFFFHSTGCQAYCDEVPESQNSKVILVVFLQILRNLHSVLHLAFCFSLFYFMLLKDFLYISVCFNVIFVPFQKCIFYIVHISSAVTYLKHCWKTKLCTVSNKILMRVYQILEQ